MNKTIFHSKFISTIIVAIVFGGLSTFMLFHSTFLSGFDALQTSPSDTRLSNYFLEHSFQVVSNSHYRGSLWSPPFFFPETGILTYSENFWGTAPIYWITRLFCSDITAFQVWMIIVSLLNFLSLFWIFKSLGVDDLLSGLGSSLFAFGLPRFVQLDHPQLLPHFFTPLAILAAWKLIQNPSNKALSLLLILIYLQTLSSIYLGWFLLFTLGFLFLGCYLFSLDARTRFQDFFIKNTSIFFASLIGWVVATILTLKPYLDYSFANEGRKYVEVRTMLPRLSSWLSVHPSSFLHPLLGDLSSNIPMVHEHYLFMGFTLILLTMACLWSVRHFPELPKHKKILISSFLNVFFFICFISLLFPFEITIWRGIYEIIPGASAIRSVTRIGTTLYIYLLIAVFTWLDWIVKEKIVIKSQRYVIISCICLFAMGEQVTLNQPAVSKTQLNAEVKAIASYITPDCDAAYVSISPNQAFEAQHVSAMWAGMKTNTPVINGYSGWEPPNYPHLSQTMTPEQLRAWLTKRFSGQVCFIEKSESFPVDTESLRVSKIHIL